MHEKKAFSVRLTSFLLFSAACAKRRDAHGYGELYRYFITLPVRFTDILHAERFLRNEGVGHVHFCSRSLKTNCCHRSDFSSGVLSSKDPIQTQVDT